MIQGGSDAAHQGRETGGSAPGAALALHHIGFVVADIERATEEYVDRFGYRVRTPTIHDPLQTAYIRFLSLPNADSFLELVSPDGPQSKLSGALTRGGGPNHLCYAVHDIEAACREMRTKAMLLMQPPVAAAAFPGRRIAWLIGADRVPVELVERGLPGAV